MKKTIIIILSAFVAFSTVSTAADFALGASTSQQKPKKAKAEIKEVTFNAHVHCAGCVKKIQENIAFERGVKDLHVCMEDQIVYIKYDSSKTNEEVLRKAIEKLGVKVTGKSQHGHQHNHK